MFQLARTRRPSRAGEWTEAKAVTFIVTLAASRSVTLAAARAVMSRKSAYALKSRDPAFARAWHAAMTVASGDGGEEPALNSIHGNKGDEVHDPRKKQVKGYDNFHNAGRQVDAETREHFFSMVANRTGEPCSPPLAGEATLP